MSIRINGNGRHKATTVKINGDVKPTPGNQTESTKMPNYPAVSSTQSNVKIMTSSMDHRKKTNSLLS